MYLYEIHRSTTGHAKSPANTQNMLELPTQNEIKPAVFGLIVHTRSSYNNNKCSIIFLVEIVCKYRHLQVAFCAMLCHCNQLFMSC